jgi:hypothetical protein
MSCKKSSLELETIEEYIERTKSPNPIERKKALKEMCPCRVLKEFEIIWDRVFEVPAKKKKKIPRG